MQISHHIPSSWIIWSVNWLSALISLDLQHMTHHHRLANLLWGIRYKFIQFILIKIVWYMWCGALTCLVSGLEAPFLMNNDPVKENVWNEEHYWMTQTHLEYTGAYSHTVLSLSLILKWMKYMFFLINLHTIPHNDRFLEMFAKWLQIKNRNTLLT